MSNVPQKRDICVKCKSFMDVFVDDKRAFKKCRKDDCGEICEINDGIISEHTFKKNKKTPLNIIETMLIDDVTYKKMIIDDMPNHDNCTNNIFTCKMAENSIKYTYVCPKCKKYWYS